jgi:putative ABC transport system permease protein
VLHRLHKLLLHLYPAHFREEYGDEMTRLFRDRCRREGTLRVCYEALPDLAVTAWKEHMDTLQRDLKYTLRAISRNPGFAAVVLVTLALGIGANTAVFSVVKGVLLDPLPFKSPSQLVQLYEKRPKQGRVRNVVSAPDYADWKKQNAFFDDMAAMTGAAFPLQTTEGAQLILGARVTSNFFNMLGVTPALGRSFLPEEETPGKDHVLVLTHGFWQRRYGGDPAILGRKITLGGEPFEVVGVLPDIGNVIASEAELWTPLTLSPQSGRGAHFLNVYGRLKPGVSLARAQAGMDVVATRLEQQYPNENTGHGVNIFFLEHEVTGKVRPALLMLLGAVTLVLLVACANVANLFIARATQRQREISIRTALGAGAGQLVRQLLTESLVLSLLGGVIGLLLAYGGVQALKAANPGNLPRIRNIHIDLDVLLFTFAISVVSGLVFGSFPALHAARAKVATALKQGGNRSSTSRGAIRNVLVVAEIAFALILVVGSGLMLQSFVRLAAVNPGFDATHVLTVDVPLMASRYAEPQHRTAFLEELSARFTQLPGVTSVAAVNALPLTGRDAGSNFSIEGRPPLGYSQLPNGRFRVVTPSYFATLRIPLRTGRSFTSGDDAKAQPVLLINETMANQYWPGENPIGRRISLFGEEAIRRTIVGIVADVKHYALDGETRPEMYFPYAQQPERSMTIVLRTAGAPETLTSAVRAELQSIDKNQPVARIQSLEEVLASSLAQPRLYSSLLTIFSCVALLLAAVGIYGVMSFTIAQRTQEMGIRIALGAKAGNVRRLILKQGLALAITGVALGVAGALTLTRAMEALLYNVQPTDPATFAISALLLVAIAAAACYLPARRATRVDPIIALRTE